MPSWKPDCLKSSATFNHLSHTINSAKLLHADIHDPKNNLTTNLKTSIHNKHNNNRNSNNNIQSALSKSDSTSQQSARALSFQNASSSKLSMQKGYSLVELIRSNNSQFGLTIAGGTDKDSRPRICDLKAGSIAHRSDELQIGDMIISINGIKTQGLKHEEIIDLIKNAGDSLCLEFEYNLPPWPIHPHHAVRSQTVHIQLEKENNSYGFTLRGGFSDEKLKARPLIVTNIRSGGSADREGTLKIGDRIVAINGINILNASLQDAYNIVKQCKGVTLFLVEYDSAIVDSIKNSNGPLLIEIEKSPGSSIGIKLALNKNQISGKNQILVESVKPASIADRCGAIYVGDQILSIDDVSFEHVTLAEADQILKNCVGEFSRVEILPLSQMLSGKYQNNKNGTNDIYENNTINVSNGSTKSNSSSFTVNSSSSGTSLANNLNNYLLQQQANQNSNGSSSSNYGNMMPNFENSDSLIQISQMNQFNAPNFNDLTIQAMKKIILKNQSRSSNKNTSSSTLKTHSRDRQNSISHSASSKSLIDLNKEYRLVDMQKSVVELKRKLGSINSCSASLSSNQVSHSETVEFQLMSDDNGTYGFTLQGAGVVMSSGNNSNDTLQNIVPFPVVGYVEPSSAAERCSLMQPGDRIIAVNQRSLEGLSVEEARQIIKESGSSLCIEIEFDVADTIMLTSGVFQVKLLKKNLELGIVVEYPRYWKAENYPYINELRKGSVAYRNGMLQRGDTILFIDNVSLRNKSLNEINQLLKTSEEVVKLKIRKEEQITENPEEKLVVYTVEMQRNGGPLGITISGSDDLFEPMFVSGLTEGGLAERTNAIHVGDIILAINNVSLRGKSLSEAIELLQNADDMVTLKISRKLEKGLRFDEFQNQSKASFQSKNSQLMNFKGIQNLQQQQQLLNHEMKDDFDDTFSKSSHFLNENTNSVNSSTSHQYLPFPMDMTNFIKSNQIKSKSVIINGKLNTNESSPKIRPNSSNQKFSLEDLKKKATSLDSINAVERELDEVLKDLELNSLDLNDQLSDNIYHKHNKGSIELPISIQKNGYVVENGVSSSPISMGNQKNQQHWPNSGNMNTDNFKEIPSRTNNQSKVNNHSSEFIDLNQTDPYESYDRNVKMHMKPMNDDSNKKPLSSLKKRQNIISTYELCNDCFENSGVLQSNGEPVTCQHHMNNQSNGQQSSQSKISPKNTVKPQNSGCSDFNFNGYSNKSQSHQTPTTPVKYTSTLQSPQNGQQSFHMNQDPYTNRSRTVLTQINESVESKQQQPVSILRNSSKNNDSLKSNGVLNVTSQKVITIGMPNGQKTHDECDNQSESRPIVTKITNGSTVQLKPAAKEDEKLDRLPPVPPSSWSNRRNQSQYSSNNRLRRQNSKTPTNCSQNDISDASQQVNELIIQESGTSSFEEDSSNTSPTQKNETDSKQMNYDNFNLVENKSDTDSDPEEKLEITISRDARFKDFGFSISDNFFGRGILVNKIRNGSPADEDSSLKPFTQIYKINNIDCTELDCVKVSSILANEQSNKMHLIISSKPKRLSLSNDATISERKLNLQNAYAISSSRATAL